jgi:hypothetical protein
MICGKSTFGPKISNTPADVEKFNLKLMTHKLSNDQIENRVWSELVIKCNLQIVFKWHFIYYLSTFNDRALKFFAVQFINLKLLTNIKFKTHFVSDHLRVKIF